MKKFLLIALLFIAGVAKADVPEAQRGEVKHLLAFVKQSTCSINRNGQDHNGTEALAHIQNKYDYFRDKIHNTEEFIDLSASKSTMSGRYYTVKCGDQAPIRARDWLLHELSKYRSQARS